MSCEWDRYELFSVFLAICEQAGHSQWLSVTQVQVVNEMGMDFVGREHLLKGKVQYGWPPCTN